jgi:EmrB/QacA subfamily drug resistance transporter
MGDTTAEGASGATGGRSKNLVLAAMIFAVAMMFIDQTIVSIAAPNIQSELGLTSTGIQWAINSYLLALAAFFAFGGRLADTLGHRRMVTIGIVVFAAASLFCGLTPKGNIAQGWLVAFRAVQGFGGAMMFPAALAIVVQTFQLRERGKALALFFGIAGGLTAVGPSLGGVLTLWTWRAIFWVNLPIAAIALVLTALAKPVTASSRARIDFKGLALIASGVALSIFGFQQSGTWGWTDAKTVSCIVGGALILVVFVLVERGVPSPLIDIRIFRIKPFFVENMVLFTSNLVFVPVFFFASEYAQVGLGKSASSASLVLLYFFLGFVVASQIGGRLLDRRGAKRPVVVGCALAAAGFYLWAHEVTKLSAGGEVGFVILTGAGMGLMLGPASTDAVNRASRLSYGEATGITQTVRNYAASLGLAILGSVLVSRLHSQVTTSLVAQGVPRPAASAEASTIAESRSGGATGAIPHFIRLDFAHAIQTVLYGMCGIMAVAALIAFVGLSRGVQQETDETEANLVAEGAT